jgi:hypothetical protein
MNRPPKLSDFEPKYGKFEQKTSANRRGGNFWGLGLPPVEGDYHWKTPPALGPAQFRPLGSEVKGCGIGSKDRCAPRASSYVECRWSPQLRRVMREYALGSADWVVPDRRPVLPLPRLPRRQPVWNSGQDAPGTQGETQGSWLVTQRKLGQICPTTASVIFFCSTLYRG